MWSRSIASALLAACLGVPQAVARTLVEDLWLDIAVVLLVSVLVTVELLSFAFGMEGGQALRGAARRIEALRRGDLRSHPRVEGRGALVSFVRSYDDRVESITLEQSRLRERAEAIGDAEALNELDALERRYRMNETRGELPLRVAAIRTPLFLFFFAPGRSAVQHDFRDAILAPFDFSGFGIEAVAILSAASFDLQGPGFQPTWIGM